MHQQRHLKSPQFNVRRSHICLLIPGQSPMFQRSTLRVQPFSQRHKQRVNLRPRFKQQLLLKKQRLIERNKITLAKWQPTIQS